MFEPYVGQAQDLHDTAITLAVIASVLVAVRMVSTWRNQKWFGKEDVFVMLSAVILDIFAAMEVEAARNGFGKHVGDIKKTGGNLDLALKYYWIAQVLYKIDVTLTKLAFLFLYLRIFDIPTYKRITTILIAIVAAWGTAFTLVMIFQCSPVEKAYQKKLPGHCINPVWFRWTSATSNLFLDLVIFVLPMPVIWRLRISIGKKAALIFVFAIGFFICITTALRLQTLMPSTHATEATYDSCPATLWAYIEAAVSVLCACLISLRKTFASCWPTIRKLSKHSGSSHTLISWPSSNRNRPRKDVYELGTEEKHSISDGTTHDPDGNLLGVSQATVMGGTAHDSRKSSQEGMIEVKRDIDVSTTV